MLKEKLNVTAMTDYVMRKYHPAMLTITDLGNPPLPKSTHVIYEISGENDNHARTLTRIGEATVNAKSTDDFVMNIYPHFYVSGELLMMKLTRT